MGFDKDTESEIQKTTINAKIWYRESRIEECTLDLLKRIQQDGSIKRCKRYLEGQEKILHLMQLPST